MKTLLVEAVIHEFGLWGRHVVPCALPLSIQESSWVRLTTTVKTTIAARKHKSKLHLLPEEQLPLSPTAGNEKIYRESGELALISKKSERTLQGIDRLFHPLPCRPSRGGIRVQNGDTCLYGSGRSSNIISGVGFRVRLDISVGWCDGKCTRKCIAGVRFCLKP